MARDVTLALRRAIIAAYQQDAAVAALVAQGDIHPQSPLVDPTWPFIRMGAMAPLPIRATGLDGVEVPLTNHCFAKARYDDGAMAETAEDHCHRIVAAMASALDRVKLQLDAGVRATARIYWNGSQIIQDAAEETAYHGIVNYTVRVFA